MKPRIPESFPVVPGFRIEQEIGRGTSARVFRARQEKLNRLVALKVIATLGEEGNRRALRLFREASLTGALDHPGIVRAIDAGDRDDFCWFAMELVEGRTLQQVLDESGPWPWRRAVALGVEILDALDHAHRRGVVHRDLKPSNILIDSEGHARLLDLGLARREADPRLTHEGGTVGTPRFMAPEQALNPGKVDGRADLFALGAVLYRTMSGIGPFDGDTVAAVLTRLLYDEPTPLSMLQPDLPEAVSLVVGKVLQKDPAHRFQDAHAFAEALREAARGRRPRSVVAPRRRKGIVAASAAAVVLALIGIACWKLLPRASPDGPQPKTSGAPARPPAPEPKVAELVPPARPDLNPLDRARLALAAADRDPSSPATAADLKAALAPLRTELGIAAAQHTFAARGVLLSSGVEPARQKMAQLEDRLREDVSPGEDEPRHPGLDRLVEEVARDATTKFDKTLKTEQLDAASDLEAELERLVTRPGNEKRSPEEQQDLVQQIMARGGVLSLEGDERARVLRKRDDVLRRLAAIPVEANRRVLDHVRELMRDERFGSARRLIASLTADGSDAADPGVVVATRPMLDAIAAGERALVARAEAAVERVGRGEAASLDAAARKGRATSLAASVEGLGHSVEEVPQLREPLALAAKVSKVAAEAAGIRDAALERIGAAVPDHGVIDWKLRRRGSVGNRYVARREGGKIVVRRPDGAEESWEIEQVSAQTAAEVMKLGGEAPSPVAVALLEYWDGEDDAADARLKTLLGEPVRDWLLGVVGASIEAAASSYATEAEREAFPAFLQARRRFAEGAFERALELAEPLVAQKKLAGTAFLRQHQGELETIVAQSRLAVTKAARMRPFSGAAEVKDEKAGLVRLLWTFNEKTPAGGLALPPGAELLPEGLKWPGRTGDRAPLPEHAHALRVAFVEGTPAAPAMIEIELLRSPDPVPFVGLSYGGLSLLALGDLRRSNAFAGVPLHGLERDLVQIQSVQKAVLLTGSLADARKAIPLAGRAAPLNLGETTVVRLLIDPDHVEVTGSFGDARISLTGERRPLAEPPALDLRLPPGMVVRSLSIELLLLPKKPS